MGKILITGSEGFLGKNLQVYLSGEEKTKEIPLVCFDKEQKIEDLGDLISEIDFIYHLAGVNRSEDEEEFFQGNYELTKKLIKTIESKGMKIPIIYSSSIQAEKDNSYGKSKRLAEVELIKYSEKNDVPVFIYRFTNLFGKWSRPNYNSVVATFCHNVSRNIPISISNPENELELAYVDDVVKELVNCMKSFVKEENTIFYFNKTHKIKLGELAKTIKGFESMRRENHVPTFNDEFTKFLYSTYISYLQENEFAIPLVSHKDNRGSFTEFVKTNNSGQFSISTTNPGKELFRGNHHHKTKTEKFFVARGKASVKFRDIFTDKIIEYEVSEDEPMSIDIPPGYTHKITNIGNKEMILLIWANEKLDKENSDTYFLEVEKKKENEI